MNVNAEPPLLDLDALTRELLFSPPVLHSENAQHPFAARSAAESQRVAPKRTRKKNVMAEAVEPSAKSARLPPLTNSSEAASKASASVEVTELLAALTEAFDHVVGGLALSKDSSLKGRLIFRMKRRLVMRAAERYIQSSVCASVEDVADEVLSEAYRLQCIPK